MVTTPIGKMGAILQAKLDPGSVFLGDLPDELKNSSFAHITTGAGTLTTVKLEALARFYRPAAK